MSHYCEYTSVFENSFGYPNPIEQNSSRPLKDYLNFPKQPTPSYTTPLDIYHDFNFYSCANQFSPIDSFKNHDHSHLDFIEGDDFSARLNSLSQKVELLEKENFQNFNEIEVKCLVCDSSSHKTDFCPKIPILKKIVNRQNSDFHPPHIEDRFHSFQSQGNDPYLSGYDPNCYTYPNSYDDPNIFWSDDSVQFHQPCPLPPHQFELEQGSTSDVYQSPYEKSLEDTLQEFMESQIVLNEQMAKSLDDVRNQLTEPTQTMSESESEEFPTQPNQNPTSQCLGEESSFNAPIDHDPVQPTPIPRSDDPIEIPDDPTMVHPVIEEKLDQKEASLEEEVREEEEDRTQELKCQDVIGLSTEPKFLIFRWVYTSEDQIKPDMCEVLVRINVPHSEIRKLTLLGDTFPKDICAFMRKIKNNCASDVMNGSYYMISAITLPYKEKETPTVEKEAPKVEKGDNRRHPAIMARLELSGVVGIVTSIAL